MHERGREVEPAAHAARVGADAPVRGVRQAHAGQQRVAAAGRLLAGQPVQSGLQVHQLAAGHERVERGLLERDADRAPHAGRVAHDVEAGNASRVPPVGASSVTSIRTVVVLPAPFGPRKA